MILLVGFYLDPDPARRGELIECLRRNAANERIDQIHVFVEDEIDPAALLGMHPDLGDPKVRMVAHGRRLTYDHLFEYANRHLEGRTVALSNADIYFDGSLADLEGRDLRGRLLCLSRWDVLPDGAVRFFDHPFSQDAWIFQAPIRRFPCAFSLGLLGCDNRLAWEAAHAGLTVTNPALSIRAYHLHVSQVRRYDQWAMLPGPIRPIPAGHLDVAGEGDGACADAVVEDASGEAIYALTSLSPAAAQVDAQRACIRSWREVGMRVRSFNHVSEIEALRALYDVELIPLEDSSAPAFGAHYVRINTMLDWAATCGAPVMLVNSDIDLRITGVDLKRMRWIADGGLCFFVRFNHDGDPGAASRELYGIDAFLFHGRDATLFAGSLLSMGQPFWDYWIPHTFSAAGRATWSVEFPAAFHREHPRRWAPENWRRCAIEMDRLSGLLGDDRSMDACMRMASALRSSIDDRRTAIPEAREPIAAWVERTFGHAEPKTFIEIGSHRGGRTAWLASLPAVALHAFEPDPRNRQAARGNVTLNRAAIGAADGRAPFTLSETGWGQEWTHSSSIKRPKNHLRRYPVAFGETIDVETVALDSYRRRHGLDVIDLVWAEAQGAEGDVIAGGAETLSRTRYLYSSYSDDEMYEGQVTLRRMMELLPGFRVKELWGDEVLLENSRFTGDTREKIR